MTPVGQLALVGLVGCWIAQSEVAQHLLKGTADASVRPMFMTWFNHSCTLFLLPLFLALFGREELKVSMVELSKRLLASVPLTLLDRARAARLIFPVAVKPTLPQPDGSRDSKTERLLEKTPDNNVIDWREARETPDAHCVARRQIVPLLVVLFMAVIYLFADWSWLATTQCLFEGCLYQVGAISYLSRFEFVGWKFLNESSALNLHTRISQKSQRSSSILMSAPCVHCVQSLRTPVRTPN